MKKNRSHITCSVACLVAALLITVFHAFAQTPASKTTSITLLTDDASKIVLKFAPGSMMQQTVTTPEGNAVIITTDQGTPVLKAGFPDLPKLTASVIIPHDKSMSVTVTDSKYTDYENITVAPSKGSMMRDTDPASVAYTYNEVYNDDHFFPKQLAELRDPYILRDVRGQTVLVYPFQYNAFTKTLRVYSEITVALSPDGNTPVNVLQSDAVKENKPVSAFSQLYSNRFLNFKKDLRYDPLEEEGNMLIISYGPFMNALQPLADWKIQKGIRTEIVDVAAIGNNKTAIKNFVADYYNTKGLTYLLLAGDAAQVAFSSTGAGDSDNDYGYISGNDHYQEIFVGRFSAESEADIINQVSKTLAYEQAMPTDDYFSKGVCIASNEGAGIGDDGEADFTHEELIRTQLLDYSYTSAAALFDGTHGNADAPGNPVASDLSAQFNNGTGIINYTGHGSGSSLSTTNFSITDANNLTNTQQWPFMWVVGCSVGNFTGTTCLAEALARSSHNGQPAGAVASFMSTILQAWAEPMEAQDEMNLLLTESYTGNIKQTFGGLSINGCFSMNDKYGATGFNMTDTWTVFGDPSLQVRTATPVALTATHDAYIELGSTHFAVGCDADGALAALTVHGTIIATATITGGMADLTFDQLTIDDTLLLTITGYNKTPYIATIPTLQPAGAFVFCSATAINDIQGNNNGMADFDEQLQLNVTLKNLGLSDASGVTATLMTTDPYITITEATAAYSIVGSNDSVMQSNAFALQVAGNVPDGHVILFTCIISDNTAATWNSSFSLQANAPVPIVNTLVIDDATGGNGDGHLDPAETVFITVTTSNNGHSNSSDAIADLTSNSNFITVNNTPFAIGDFLAGENQTATFSVTVAPIATFGLPVIFTCGLETGDYSAIKNFTTVISPAIEDFETGDFTAYDWQLSGTANWFTSTANTFEGSYCSQSGNVNDFQSSTLEIILPVQFDDVLSFAHKVSSEAGYDSLAFYIDGILQNSWSGELPWSVSSYAVDSGWQHFKWVYAKDGYFSDGADAAWLDDIHLPAFEVNTATSLSEESNAHFITAFPNPFETLTTISYHLTQPSVVNISLRNLSGQEIKKLVEQEKQTAGDYRLMFDGSKLPAGMYGCYITFNGKTIVEKLVMTR